MTARPSPTFNDWLILAAIFVAGFIAGGLIW